MQKIYVWPDGTWMHSQDYCDYDDRWRGEDFHAVELPDHYMDDDIDVAVNPPAINPRSAQDRGLDYKYLKETPNPGGHK